MARIVHVVMVCYQGVNEIDSIYSSDKKAQKRELYLAKQKCVDYSWVNDIELNQPDTFNLVSEWSMRHGD